MNILGIDIGTSTVEDVLFDTNTGRYEVFSQKNAGFLPGTNGEDVQDAEAIFSQVIRRIEERSAASSKIGGIALTGQMHGILYLDSGGKAVSPLFTWQDQRGNRLFRDNQTYAQRLTNLTGRKTASGFGLTTHFYQLLHHQVPSQAQSIASIADYTACRLAGRVRPVTEPSNAASLGVFDLSTNQFDAAALKNAAISPDILPNVLPYSVIGRYQDIPVLTPIGDNQASFAGAVHDRLDTTHLMVGTSAQMTHFTSRCHEIPGLETRPFPGGGYILVGAVLAGGSVWAVWNRFIETILHQFGHSPAREAVYRTMEQMAQAGLNNPDPARAETFFLGTRTDPARRGIIRNLTPENFTPESISAALLAGIADELAQFYELLPESERLREAPLAGSGNGLTKNPLLVQAVEARFQKPLLLPDSNAAAGAAFLAGKYLLTNEACHAPIE